MNAGIVDSELNFNFRLFCKTVSNSASWGFDRFRLFNSRWHTKVQVRRPDGSVVATQSFAPDGAFEHTFSFDLSDNVNKDEYSVYIAGIAVGQVFNQAYAYPTGYSATTGKNAELTYWDFREVNVAFSGTTGRIRFNDNPISKINVPTILLAAEVLFTNCQLGAEDLADAIIALDNSGISNGSFYYTGNLAAPAERALPAYNNLKNVKTWVMNGEVPVDAPQYDADYQAKLDFAQANSIPVPSVAQSDIYNQTILDVKTTGAWLSSSIAFDFSGDADIQFKLICLKRRVLAIAYGGGVWSQDGWLGNGTNSYIDPLYDTTSDTNWQLNSAGVFWKSFQKSTGSKAIIGSSGGTISDYTLIIPNNGVDSYASINGTVNMLSPYGRLGLNMVSRFSSTELKINEVTGNVNSQLRREGALVIGARTTATKDTLSLFTNEGIGFIAIGGDTSNDYTNLKTIFG